MIWRGAVKVAGGTPVAKEMGPWVAKKVLAGSVEIRGVSCRSERQLLVLKLVRERGEVICCVKSQFAIEQCPIWNQPVMCARVRGIAHTLLARLWWNGLGHCCS